ncbi:hypothetical protein BDV28DRAFT_103421 [Aspergillus coremiiformis]|uniref:Uncharacterized protein n=1 Tax=Aspergillus coremiiformis TaxID=138285 RepID=A0A5N6ZI98_9EURO|nr:hypothetical protein BDV28DRAFT_103421 [Aspergillus coremiiformis]
MDYIPIPRHETEYAMDRPLVLSAELKTLIRAQPVRHFPRKSEDDVTGDAGFFALAMLSLHAFPASSYFHDVHYYWAKT